VVAQDVPAWALALAVLAEWVPAVDQRGAVEPRLHPSLAVGREEDAAAPGKATPEAPWQEASLVAEVATLVEVRHDVAKMLRLQKGRAYVSECDSLLLAEQAPLQMVAWSRQSPTQRQTRATVDANLPMHDQIGVWTHDPWG